MSIIVSTIKKSILKQIKHSNYIGIVQQTSHLTKSFVNISIEFDYQKMSRSTIQLVKLGVENDEEIEIQGTWD